MEQLFHTESTDHAQFARTFSECGYSALKELHSTFEKRRNFQLKLDLDDSKFFMESTKPSFLRYISPHCLQPVTKALLLHHQTISSLKIIPQNENAIIILERHLLQCFKSSFGCSYCAENFLGPKQRDWKSLTDLVENIYKSWVSHYALLDLFFSNFADWIGLKGLKVIVQKAKHEELEVALELWKEVKLCQVTLTVFFENWTERPKVVVEVLTVQGEQRSMTVRKIEEIRALFKMLGETVLHDKEPLPTAVAAIEDSNSSSGESKDIESLEPGNLGSTERNISAKKKYSSSKEVIPNKWKKFKQGDSERRVDAHLSGVLFQPAQELYEQLETILNISADMAPVSVEKFQQEIPRLKKIVTLLWENRQVRVKLDKDELKIQATSGLCDLTVNLKLVCSDPWVTCQVEMDGPRGFKLSRQFFLVDGKHFVQNLIYCLSHFCSKAQNIDQREGQIVVGVVKENGEIKTEIPEKSSNSHVSSEESEFWMKLEHLKQEVNS